MSRPARTRRVLAVGIPVALVTALSMFGSWVAAGPASGAAPATSTRKVVVILADRMSAKRMAAVGGAQQLDALGASGLMITATGPGSGGDTSYAGVASLSAGAPAIVPEGQPQPRSVTSPAPPALGPVVVPDTAALRRANAAPEVAAAPGLLGQTLQAHGIRTAAIGDSDLPGAPYRPAPYLAMNGQGVVPVAAVGGTDMPQSASALHVTVRLAAIEAATKTALASARFLVVDWGDGARVDRLEQADAARMSVLDAAGRPLSGRLSAARTASMARLSTYLQFLQGQLDLKQDVIVLLSPNPPTADEAGGLELAPISAAGGPVGHGSLTSGSTHVTGFVSNQDLAPSVLTWFGLAVPSQMRGHAFTTRASGLGLSGAESDENQLRRVLAQREWVLFAATLLWLAALGLSLWLVERRLRVAAERSRKRQERPDEAMRSERFARWLLFAAALLPLALLLQPLVAAGSTWLVLVEVLGAVLVAGWLLSTASRKRAPTGLGAVGILTLLAFLGDRAFGGWLAQRSLTGPNISGAVMIALCAMQVGAVVAAGVLAGGAMARGARSQPAMRWFWPGLTAAVLVLFALPFMGGSTAVAAAGLTGLAVVGALTLRKPPARRVWELAGLALLVALIALGIALLVGRVAFVRSVAAVDGVHSSAASVALSLIVHTIGSWGRLLLVTTWTPIIVVAVVAVGFAEVRFRRVPGAEGPRAKTVQPPDRYARATVAGLAAAALVALLVSVTGPIAAGVLLMGTAVLAAAAAMERARAVPR
jgi:hypothetical protein